MRILFLGAGALGGYFGARMTAGGADVTLLVRPARQAQLANGLTIDSPLGALTTPVRTITATDKADPFDVIVLANKAYGLTGALDAIAPFTGPGTVLLPILNGTAHIPAVEARFPDAATLIGIAQIPAELRPDGSVLHRGTLANLITGIRPGQESHRPAARAFIEAASVHGIDARLSDTIEQEFWEKYVFLSALAAGCCLMRGNVGAINRTDHGTAIMQALIRETSAIATAEGFPPEPRRMAFFDQQLTTPTGDFKASMLTDLEAGNPTEADHIIGHMIRRAAAHGIATPYLATALTHLQVYERSRQAG